ncbi:MAG: NAD(P)H-binding protein [Candidatus Obscuribacterales bacterium]
MAEPKLMLVLGAAGFLGSVVVKQMIAEGYQMRVITRGAEDWKDSSISSLRHKGVDVIVGDVTDEETLGRALNGVSAVVNMVGSFKESGGVSFEDLHVRLVKSIVKLGQERGVQRLVHVSCLGAREDTESACFLTKWQGEQIVSKSHLYWTIFRPSFLFGETRFPLFAYLKPLLTFKLFLPMIGSGTNTVAPVFVNDVASCVTQSIYSRHTVSRSFDLVGPEEYAMVELLEQARKQLGLRGPTMNIPSKLSGQKFEMVARALPKALMNQDLASIMSENSCSSQDVMLKHFEVRNVALEQYFSRLIETL